MGDDDALGGSEDLIRQARESLSAPTGEETEIRLQLKASPQPEDPPQPAPELEYSRKPSPPGTFAVATEPSSQSEGRLATASGMVILALIGILWALLIIGIVIDPTDAGSAILGAIVITALPVALGIYLLRRGRRKKQQHDASGFRDFTNSG
jgi:hypothetical protein